jgi:uncharacterized protein (TIGR02466 family)
MFTIPIAHDCFWQEPFPNEVLELQQAVEQEFEKDNRGRIVSNIGGWQSQLTLQNHPIFNHLKFLIEQHAKQVHLEMELVDNVKFTVCNMWANINWHGNSNAFHQHTNPPSVDCISSTPVLSGTFYVKVPSNSGRLAFHSTRQDYSKASLEPSIVRLPEIYFKNLKNPHIRPIAYYQPKEGDLLLWIADLMHGVEPNQNETEHRISISFNLGLEFNTCNI